MKPMMDSTIIPSQPPAGNQYNTCTCTPSGVGEGMPIQNVLNIQLEEKDLQLPIYFDPATQRYPNCTLKFRLRIKPQKEAPPPSSDFFKNRTLCENVLIVDCRSHQQGSHMHEQDKNHIFKNKHIIALADMEINKKRIFLNRGFRFSDRFLMPECFSRVDYSLSDGISKKFCENIDFHFFDQDVKNNESDKINNSNNDNNGIKYNHSSRNNNSKQPPPNLVQTLDQYGENEIKEESKIPDPNKAEEHNKEDISAVKDALVAAIQSGSGLFPLSICINDTMKKKKKKPLKPRQNFTENQRTILNKYLQSHSGNPYAGSNDVLKLAELTGLQPRQIRTYFTNKRMRDPKGMNLSTARGMIQNNEEGA